jgi:translocator protein
MFVMSTSKAGALRVGNILAFIVTLIVNGLANTTLLGGKTTAQISNQNPTLITPAGYVFAIWGIIYALLAVFVVYQALPSQKSKEFHNQISALFILGSAFNVVWIFLWGYGYVATSVVPMLGLLATLAAIYLRLKIGKSEVPSREKACVHLPFSVYLGWITVAAAADIAAALSSVGWITWAPSDAVWGILAAAIVLFITLVTIKTRGDIAYALVIIWALVGIAVNQSAVTSIVYTMGIAAVIVAAAILASKLKNSKKP